MRRKSFVYAITIVIIVGLLPSTLSIDADDVSGWGIAQSIEVDSSGTSSGPQVSVDSSGNAIAVWSHWNGTRYDIWSNRHVVGTGWGTSQLVETNDTEQATLPQVSADNSGNAIAVWYQWDGIHNASIWSNRYAVGTGWGIAQVIEIENSTDTYFPDRVSVEMDGSGNAIVVWVQDDGVRHNIRSNRYAVGTGWGTSQLIETNDSEDASSPQVSVDSSGNAVAVWSQGAGIWSNRYVVGTGWGVEQLIQTGIGGAYDPQVSVDTSGSAIAVWYQYDSTSAKIWSNRYVVGTGWGTAQLIENDDSVNASGPQVSVDGSGNAIAVWRQYDGYHYNISSNRYVAGTGWGTAELIGANLGEQNYDGYFPQVSVDGSGNAIAVWSQYDSLYSFNIWSSRYVAGTGWGSPQIIGACAAHDHVRVSMDGSGNAVAVWVGGYNPDMPVWSNRYSASGQVPGDERVGVKAGDWIKLDYKISGAPSGTTLPTWIKVEFLTVEGTKVDVRVTMHMSDGTEENATVTIDIVSGGEALGLSGFVIPANCTTGDSIYLSGYGNLTIAGETKRTYAGAHRAVVYASLSQYGTGLTYYWDKRTGVMVEASTTSDAMSATAEATETNMWTPDSSGLLANPTVLFVLAIGAVVTVVAVAFLVIRRRKEPPEFESPES